MPPYHIQIELDQTRPEFVRSEFIVNVSDKGIYTKTELEKAKREILNKLHEILSL